MQYELLTSLEFDLSDLRVHNHLAYFDTQTSAERFKAWLTENRYKAIAVGKNTSGYLVDFQSEGNSLDNVVALKALSLQRMAASMDGVYYGSFVDVSASDLNNH